MARQPDYSNLGRLSGIVTILPACMGAGWLLGYFLIDRYLGTFPCGTILLIFLGAGAGFYQIYRILTQKGGAGE